MVGGLYAPSARATSNSVSENYTSPVTKAASTRPIVAVAVRARKYAEQVPVATEQSLDTQGERRSLKKFRSADTSHASSMSSAMAPTLASERRAAAPPIGTGMRQQSEVTMRRPTSRITGRGMSSSAAAPPVRQAVRVPTRTDSVSGHSAGSMAPRATGGQRPSSNRGSRNTSPSRIPPVPQSPQAGGSYRGRRLVSPAEAQEESRLPRLGAGGRWVSEMERQARELASLRDFNAQLIDDLKQMNDVFNMTKAEVERKRMHAAEANERACLLEADLEKERGNSAALMDKIKALEALVTNSTAATDPAAERFEGREALQSTMSSVLAACAVAKPRAEFSAATRRDISRVEAYIAGEAPQPLYARDEEMRSSRRRSSMLFADLVLPSGGGHAMVGAGGPCERCSQLAETMQNLEADNDYYRDANRKLRDAVNDSTSRHNALVRIFEVERARRREIHAASLAEASRAATRERAMLDAEEPLASHFAHSLHIAQPAS
ncbi:hypothetical protein H4S07_003366 [Coemansia furcata]|uniref:Uncharacterized protein n=1 Tax=Coemansia furcata TaxID=417177 RepID=A0ACC1LI34_9FUNG|nr:hypothetical protein H4S07_003366 [Coemansia furcata]